LDDLKEKLDKVADQLKHPQPVADWAEYSRLVLAELERHSQLLRDVSTDVAALAVKLAKFASHEEDIKSLEEENKKLRERIAVVETKAIMYGAMSGAVISGIGGILFHFITK
jgi:cell shape-determining protein MreC